MRLASCSELLGSCEWRRKDFGAMTYDTRDLRLRSPPALGWRQCLSGQSVHVTPWIVALDCLEGFFKPETSKLTGVWDTAQRRRATSFLGFQRRVAVGMRWPVRMR